MNYLKFDRHQLFKDVKIETGRDLLDLTWDLKREISDYCLDNDIDDHSFENLMCGIFDGYLYSDLIQQAKQLGLSKSLLFKVAELEGIIFNKVAFNINL
jgi:hypothetical protein